MRNIDGLIYSSNRGINKTLKYEYGLKQTIKNTKLAQKMTKKAIFTYNNFRTHWSLNLSTPKMVNLFQDKTK
ncbi:integrase core domain-containing protein [Mangrovimonas yunxiaonensis]|uniref:integrase core domain-containing protein n=1 Tax=Mangrovimonas yunxiaonensis TaxID=1197477 RepID=UPI0006911038|nr:integrase core domain-containing protein [Mangrovimonas yunxiaonensis]